MLIALGLIHIYEIFYLFLNNYHPQLLSEPIFLTVVLLDFFFKKQTRIRGGPFDPCGELKFF